ncbi:MAG: hypothetical protein K2K17_09455, partial [Lachnospiraceae bacterium]|nr:hypothetical protein [Lachnospiraceae bacterium]
SKLITWVRFPSPAFLFCLNHNMICYLAKYELKEVYGFSQSEVYKYIEIIKSNAHLIMLFSKEGGFENDSGS